MVGMVYCGDDVCYRGVMYDEWRCIIIIARQLGRPRSPGSEANTTICFFIYILDIDSHCPYIVFLQKSCCFLFPEFFF